MRYSAICLGTVSLLGMSVVASAPTFQGLYEARGWGARRGLARILSMALAVALGLRRFERWNWSGEFCTCGKRPRWCIPELLIR